MTTTPELSPQPLPPRRRPLRAVCFVGLGSLALTLAACGSKTTRVHHTTTAASTSTTTGAPTSSTGAPPVSAGLSVPGSAAMPMAALPTVTVSNGPANPGLLSSAAPAPRQVVGQVRLASPVDAVLTRLALAANGTTNEASSLGATEAYVDLNGDGVLDATDPLLAPGLTFTTNNGRANLDGLSYPLNAGLPLDLLLTTEVRVSARVGDTVSFRVEATGSVVVDAAGAQLPVSGGALSGALQVVDPTQLPKTLIVSQGSPLTTAQSASGDRVRMSTVILSSTTGALDLHGITFETSGTGDDAVDVDEAWLGRDDNLNGVIEAGEVIARSQPDSDDGLLVFNTWGPRLVSANTRHTLLVDYTLAGTAAPGETFALQLKSAAGVNAHAYAGRGGQSISLAQAPLEGPLLTITSASPRLNVRTAGLAARTDPGGREGVSLVLDLEATGTPIDLRALTLHATGTLDDALDVAGVGLYLDSDGDGAFDPQRDARLAADLRFNQDDGEVVFALSPTPLALPVGNAHRLFVTTTLVPGLPAGRSFSLLLNAGSDLAYARALPSGGIQTGTLVITGDTATSAFVQPDRVVGKDTYIRGEGLYLNDNFGQLALAVGDRVGGQSGERLFFAEFPLPAGPAPKRAYAAFYLASTRSLAAPSLDVEVARVIPSGPRTPWLEGRGGLDPSLDGVVFDGTFLNNRPELSQPDAEATPLSEVRIAAGSEGRWVVFDVTAAAQAWYAGTAPNFGLRFRDKAFATNTEGAVGFLSSDTHLFRQRPIFLIER